MIFGVGGVGSNLVQVCKAFTGESARIIAVDKSLDRLLYAKETMGATDFVHIEDGMTESEIIKRIHSKTPNNSGADVAFEVIGNKFTARQAVLSLAPGGKAVLAGLTKPEIQMELPITHIVRRKIEIVGSFGAKASVDTPEVLKMLERRELSLESVSERFSLEEVSAAYNKLYEGNITGKAIVVM